MTEFTLDVHPNKCQLFKAWYLFFFFFLNYRRFVHHQIQNKNWLQKQLNTLFRSCLAFRSCQSPYQQLCMSFHSSFVWQAALSSEVQNQSFKEVSAMFFFCLLLLHLTFIAVQPAPGDLGRFLISEIVGNSRFPSGHISVSAPRRSNLAPAERYFYWFLLWSHSQCLSRFRKQQLLFHPFFLNIFLHHVFNCKR